MHLTSVLLIAIMAMSGCVFVDVDAPVPIPTSHRLTTLTDVTGTVHISCYNISREDWVIHVARDIIEDNMHSPLLSEYMTEHVEVIHADGLDIINTVAYPDMHRGMFYAYDSDFTGYNFCELDQVMIRYHKTKYIDGLIIIDNDLKKSVSSESLGPDRCTDDMDRCLHDLFWMKTDFESFDVWRDLAADDQDLR